MHDRSFGEPPRDAQSCSGLARRGIPSPPWRSGQRPDQHLQQSRFVPLAGQLAWLAKPGSERLAHPQAEWWAQPEAQIASVRVRGPDGVRIDTRRRPAEKPESRSRHRVSGISYFSMTYRVRPPEVWMQK